MTTRTMSLCLGAIFGLVLTAGCQQPGHDMQAGPPPRPSELDKLDQFVGTWSSTCDMTMEGKTSQCSGYGTSAWALDKRVIVSNMEFDMGGEMGKMQGMEIMTWDPSSKVYRTYWFDSMGSIGEGTMRYDEKTGTWLSKGSGRDGMSGESRANSGTMKFTSDGTNEWTFKETANLGFTTTMELKGTSRKQ